MSEGLWDRLGRQMEIAPMNDCISWQSVVKTIQQELHYPKKMSIDALIC